MTDKLVPLDGASSSDRGMVPLADVISRVRRIQEVMAALMKEGTHYGTIPGTPKPTLYQPGAELLCATFRIAPSPTVTDLSSADEVRYRVTMRGLNQATGELLGEGVGECSTTEEKYRWRKPVVTEEWDDTPEDRRREKWAKDGSGKGIKNKQVRTAPADVANTVLKMAYKRALISMTRSVLACSDIFAQDLEDLPPEVREAVVENEANGHATKPPIRPPQAKDAQKKPAPAGLRVVNLRSKAGETNGKKWTLYTIELSDERAAQTFDDKIALLAEQARDEGWIVDATIEPGKREGAFRLTELVRVTDEPLV